jgi:hypothetical protein
VSWLESAGSGDFETVFSLRPNLYQDYQAFAELFTERQLLPACLLIATRRRIAQLHNCATEMEAAEQMAAAGETCDCEAACLEIAELFAQDPHAIADAPVAAVKAELGDAGVVALMEWLAICDGFCRFRLMLEVNHGQ